VIFLLKLLRKLIGLFVKLVLLPFRLVMRLVGLRSGSDDDGSSSAASVASAAASASTTAAAGAAEAAESRREGSSGTDAAATRRVDAATRTSYGRFRKALYAYAGLGVLFYVFLWAEFGFVGDLPLVPILVGSVIPAAIGYATRTRSRLTWGAGMAYAGLFLLVSLASFGAFSTLGPSATRAFRDVMGGGVVMLLGLVSLLQIGSLAAALYFGATGRAVALGGGTVEPSATEATSDPSDPDAGAPSGPSAGASTSDSNDGGAAVSAASDTAASMGTDASDDGGMTAADTPATGASAPTDTDSAGGAAPASGAAAATGTPADDAGGEAAGADESGSEPDTTPDTGADPAPEETGPSVADLAERARSTRDPAVVRDLGEQAGGDIPDEVVAALEACAEADDPDVRVAVCEACAAIDADEADALLRQLRIDTNDRVATAAMAAY
jgi:hypothetical protein